ncbi:PepSY domain-containing protein [Pontibacter ramchanderi]|uniref:PepSY-associated transmembrane protein n=1 Tax=Pontibacter ramchanderi TaxID=1179743 RepID=A0A2N3UAB6_9BACT|nr:PepSY domain-containing protein [Pontibacter ramchanderi]PKV66311.1 PepSY-associated transmembrane protein [Pontibacter ramchanderi]
MKRRTHLRIRKTHRYLGLITGIQFVMWTIGGIYFSFSDIDEIHGDLQRKPGGMALPHNTELVSPAMVMAQLPTNALVTSVKVIDILGKPHYQIAYHENTDHTSAASSETGHNHGQVRARTQLAEAATGKLRPALTEQEAIELARQNFVDVAAVAKTEYVTDENINGHHEYRGSSLPAWAVTMEHPTKTTVYVAAEQGVVTKFRNDKWRVFDFLWMLHTMDYQGRDNFGNLLLRVFSIAGIVTILSGFALYFASSGARRHTTQRQQEHRRPIMR